MDGTFFKLPDHTISPAAAHAITVRACGVECRATDGRPAGEHTIKELY